MPKLRLSTKSLNYSTKKHVFIATLIIFAGISGLFYVTKASADITAPITTYIQTPSSPNGKNNWYITPVQFELNATDIESGVKEINYRVDGQAWQKVNFSNSLNLAPNPSFEIPGSTTTNINDWYATIVDGNAAYSRDTGLYYTGFSSSSAKINATLGPWHAINNQSQFAVANPFDNMSASVWVKTQDITGSAYFKMYSVSQDGSGNLTYVEITQSNAVTGTVNWTQLKANFVVNDPNTIGVYMDLGLDTSGILWADAVTINESLTSASADVTISTDGTNHSLEFYSVDVAENAEVYGCPATNCVTFKIDQNPPGSWYNSGAIRSVGGSDHEVYVYTNVKDFTSGLSTLSDKYMYSVDDEDGFGHYAELIKCNSAWKENEWIDLLTTPAVDGTKDATIVTQKTDLCNSNWKICKSVRFYAEDVAGNTNTKDFCINGPWIKFRGEGILRSNNNIDMIAESEEHNTDGLIETSGMLIDFFTSSRNWLARSSTPPQELTYANYLDKATNPTTITTTLVSSSGVYKVNGNFEIKKFTAPSNYDDNAFNQIVFIDGDLLISTGISIDEDSTALFIVSGDVNIDKSVDNVEIGIFADGDINTAYDIDEGEHTGTLNLKGIYSANKFIFQRTLQGTNNERYPSDNFIYEPKYLVQLRDFFGENHIIWKNID